MAPCDELGDRREPVELGNSVGSDVDAALTFKAVHGRVVNEPLDRAARERELDAVTELQRVNLSPENRFEASPLRGNSTAHRDFPGHIRHGEERSRSLVLAEVKYLCPKMI